MCRSIVYFRGELVFTYWVFQKHFTTHLARMEKRNIVGTPWILSKINQMSKKTSERNETCRPPIIVDRTSTGKNSSLISLCA